MCGVHTNYFAVRGAGWQPTADLSSVHREQNLKTIKG